SIRGIEMESSFSINLNIVKKDFEFFSNNLDHRRKIYSEFYLYKYNIHLFNIPAGPTLSRFLSIVSRESQPIIYILTNKHLRFDLLDKLSLCNNIDEITKWQSIINGLSFR